MSYKKSRLGRQTTPHGFTIVELLIVIVVIGILAAITIVAYNGVANRAHTAITTTNVKSYTTALERYYIDHDSYLGGFGCIGQGGCGSITPQGAGCAALGYESGVPILFSPDGEGTFNQGILPYIGTIPNSVQTKRTGGSLPVGEGCTASIVGDGAYYKGYQCPIAMGIYSGIFGMSVNSSSPDCTGDESQALAYYITFHIPGDSPCELPNTLRKYDTQARSTDCYAYGGAVTLP